MIERLQQISAIVARVAGGMALAIAGRRGKIADIVAWAEDLRAAADRLEELAKDIRRGSGER